MEEQFMVSVFMTIEKREVPIVDYYSSVVPREGEKIQLNLAPGTRSGVSTLDAYESALRLRVVDVVHYVSNQNVYTDEEWHRGTFTHVDVFVVSADIRTEAKLKNLIK